MYHMHLCRNWAKMVPEDSRQWFSSPIEKTSRIPVLVSKERHPIPTHRRITIWDYWNPDMNSFHFFFSFHFFLMHQGAKGWDQGGLWPLRHRWHWDNRGSSGDDCIYGGWLETWDLFLRVQFKKEMLLNFDQGRTKLSKKSFEYGML